MKQCVRYALFVKKKHRKMAKLGDFTQTHLGDKVFIHSEGFRKPNQVPVFGAAMGLAGACSGAGVIEEKKCLFYMLNRYP